MPGHRAVAEGVADDDVCAVGLDVEHVDAGIADHDTEVWGSAQSQLLFVEVDEFAVDLEHKGLRTGTRRLRASVEA